MRFTVSDEIVRFSVADRSVEGRIVHTDGIGFLIETLDGQRLTVVWELVGNGLRLEPFEAVFKRAA